MQGGGGWVWGGGGEGLGGWAGMGGYRRPALSHD